MLGPVPRRLPQCLRAVTARAALLAATERLLHLLRHPRVRKEKEGRKEERQEEEEEEGVGGLEKEQLGQLWLLLYTA